MIIVIDGLYYNDIETLGFILPETADLEGYISEKKKGNIKILEVEQSKSFTIFAGYLGKDKTKNKEIVIKSILEK